MRAPAAKRDRLRREQEQRPAPSCPVRVRVRGSDPPTSGLTSQQSDGACPTPALPCPRSGPASDAAGDPALAVVGRHAPARERPSLSFQGGEGRGPWSAKHWKRQPQTQLFPSPSPCSVPWNPAFRSRKASLHCLHLRNSFTPRRDYTLEQTSEESGCPGVLQPVFPSARLVSLKDARDGCSRVDGVCPRVSLRP